jgi:flavin-dependent dehydrogenase
MGERPDFDVVIVGASIAGCTAAILAGQAGLRCALLERRESPDAYKRVCTHFVQPSATTTMTRLGLTEPLTALGAVRTTAEVWTHAGWIRPRPQPGYPRLPKAWSIRRLQLDPAIRRLACDTPGVQFFPGVTACELLADRGRTVGVRGRTRASGLRAFRGRLVIGADGARSKIAEIAGLREGRRPHGRFYYMAYYQNLPLATGTNSQVWLLDPDVAVAFPNEDGVTVVAATPHKARLPEFKADREGAFERFVARLPDGPTLAGAERVSPLIGRLNIANLRRTPVAPGVALVGDAALSSDPIAGVGIGWAMQSAEWLMDLTAVPLRQGQALDESLARYERLHGRRLGLHARMISSYASGRPLNPFERALLGGAAQDPALAAALHTVTSRCVSPLALARPVTVARILRPHMPRCPTRSEAELAHR